MVQQKRFLHLAALLAGIAAASACGAPPPAAAAYYEAARVLMTSIQSSSAACRCTPARSDVVRTLRHYRSDGTTIGDIAFDASGERTSARMALVRIRGESYTVVKEFSINAPRRSTDLQSIHRPSKRHFRKAPERDVLWPQCGYTEVGTRQSR